MNTRSLLYVFLSLHAIHAAANNEPGSAVELQNAVTLVTAETAEDVFKQVCEAGRFDLIKDLMQHGQFRKLPARLGGTGPLVDWALSLGYPEAARAIVYASGNLQDLLIRACGKGYLSVVDILLHDPLIDVAAGNQAALVIACQEGQLPVVERLASLPKVDPSTGGNYEAAVAAITNDRFEVLRYMQTCARSAEFIQPGSRRFVYKAMKNGNLEALVLLMERDHTSHARLEGYMLEGLKIDVTKLPPLAVQACVEGNLEILSIAILNPYQFHSLDEFDVLLGLARRHPKLIAFLKRRQHAYLRQNVPYFAEKGKFAKDSLLRKLEKRQKYGFFIGKQFRFMEEHLDEYLDSAFKFSQLPGTLEAYSFKRIDRSLPECSEVAF
jgi:hypothetical protein